VEEVEVTEVDDAVPSDVDVPVEELVVLDGTPVEYV
jgi:hypothetical protein